MGDMGALTKTLWIAKGKLFARSGSGAWGQIFILDKWFKNSTKGLRKRMATGAGAGMFLVRLNRSEEIRFLTFLG